MANVLENSGDDGQLRARIYASGHPDDWDRMIRNLAIWSLALLAFLCGLVATLTLFGTKSQMAFLGERTAQLGSLISHTNEIDKRVGSLAEELRALERKGAATEAKTSKVDLIESSVSTLSQRLGNISTDVRLTEAKFEDKINIYDSEISQMELRLSKSEKTLRIDEKPDNAEDEPAIVATKSQPAGPRQNTIKYFSVVRILGDRALVAGPQGWFQVAVGSFLPGGAKILDIVKRNNHSVVVTDQGPITRAH